MYALLLNEKIVGSCETLNDVDFCILQNSELTYLEAPSDFVVHEYFFNGLALEKKSEAYLENERALLEIQSSRAKQYPPITDYIDGVVKGDQAQIQAYIDECLAVKAKYPKP
jgi:hypothetical protein